MIGIIIVLALLCLVLGMSLCFLMLSLDDLKTELELYNMYLHRLETKLDNKEES